MNPAQDFRPSRRSRPLLAALLAALAGAALAQPAAPAAPAAAPAACKPLYLTLDSSHLEAAPMLVETLHKQSIVATFFVANEMQTNGKTAIDRAWGRWWASRAREGHDMAPRTWDRVEWRSDLPGREPRFHVKVHDGAFAGREFTWKGQQYCENLHKTAERLNYYSGKPPLQLFHAEGRASQRLLELAASCGYQHVGWTEANFLASKDWTEGKKPYDALASAALEALPAHAVLKIGTDIWVGHDNWSTGNALNQFIAQAKAQGYCFKPLREHPQIQPWLAAHPYKPQP